MSGNDNEDEGAEAIAEALKVTAVLTTLNLADNSIGYEGAKAIADSLKSGMAVLTTLCLDRADSLMPTAITDESDEE